MREKEVMMIYLMNERAIIVDTPVEYTRMINAKEIIKQGTVFGPKLWRHKKCE